MITPVAFLTTPISCALAFADMRARGVALGETALIMVRPHIPDWAAQCRRFIPYPSKPANDLLGQRKFIDYYRESARLLHRIEGAGGLKRIYIVNNDNLIASHLLAMAESRPSIEVDVVAEGLMNFQDIGTGNRAGWRWRVKPILARLLSLRYRHPETHLSGAFEPEVDRVLSFASHGFKAPPEKVEIIDFPGSDVQRQGDPEVAMIPLTGLAQWMPAERVPAIAEAFRDWLIAQNFKRLLVKPHPHSDAGLIGELLPPHEIVTDARSLEAMAGELEAGTIVGTCCTGLVTLKLMRPDLRCVDFGADYYQEHAYRGDRSVETLLRASGVEMVSMCGDSISPAA